MKTKPTHTPGPWTFRRHISGTTMIEASINGSAALIANVHARMATGTFTSETLPQSANARLIAAAPDLLAALKNEHRHCLANLEGHLRNVPNCATCAAISKAEVK